MDSRSRIRGGVDRGRVTLVAYGVLLLSITLPAWIALGGVLAMFLSSDEEFGGNFLLLLIYVPVFLVIALTSSGALLMLLRRQSASYLALISWSGLAMLVTLAGLNLQGLFDFSSIDYQYVLESNAVRAVAILCVLSGLVLVSALMDARYLARHDAMHR